MAQAIETDNNNNNENVKSRDHGNVLGNNILEGQDDTAKGKHRQCVGPVR